MFRLSAPVRNSVVAFAVAVGFSVNAAEPTGTTQPAQRSSEPSLIERTFRARTTKSWWFL